MIRQISHYTLNTGDVRVTTPDEVCTTVYFRLKSIIKKAMETEYVDLIQDTKIRLTIEKSTYACTLYSCRSGEDMFPILYTCGCSNSEDMQLLWPSTVEMFEKVCETSTNITPAVPFIADIVLPASIERLDALQWTGDFCKSLGWMIMEPKAIVEV